jgi:hypothetical protein
MSESIIEQMIEKAIKERVVITLIPRRTHAVHGIPTLYEFQTKRVFMETNENVESFLLSDVAHYAFPKSLYTSKEDIEKQVVEAGKKVYDKVKSDSKV